MNIRVSAILGGLAFTLAFPALAVGQTYDFTTCGATGHQGPAQGDCDTTYTATTLDGAVTVSGGIQTWTVPATGSYQITAVGAAGKSATDGAYNGGRGAQISGTFNLTAGDILQIVVGQEGSASEGGDQLVGETPTGNAQAEDPSGGSLGVELDGGGGGGSFVVDNSDNPMLIAGGGGGTRHSSEQNGCDANTGQYATDSSGGESSGGCAIKGDGLGLGGIIIFSYGSAGAGFNGNGEDDSSFGQGGRSWANGMLGGHVDNNNPPGDGGFGGGGTGEGADGGGGGGGYSGGDGGYIAGGGGSFNNGANPEATAGIGTGDGSVTIQLVEDGSGGDDGGTRATFEVTKEFTDGDNPTEVKIALSCNTGLILDQTKTIDETESVIFVVTDFDDGELNCEITEESLAGYTPTYQPGGPGSFNSDGGCNFSGILSGDENTCHIVNDAANVEIEIEKVWVIDGSGGESVDTSYQLTLYCNALIEDANQCYLYGDFPAGSGNYSCKRFYGDDSQVFTAYVQPEYPSSDCWVDEYVYDGSVEIDNGCGNIVISAGVGDSCVITNSVFFEGIPSLNQYGLAVLALLMLGVGLVGFRRFV